MKKNWNKKTICLAAAALVLTVGVGVGSSLAYFTTYVEADGGVQLSLGSTTTIPKEDVTEGSKHVQIENTGDQACFVRVKAFAGSEYADGLKYEDASGKWTPGADGYYYYSDVLLAGATTDELLIHLGFESLEEDVDAFNVIVVQEATPVLYDEDGNAYADWSVTGDIIGQDDVKEVE